MNATVINRITKIHDIDWYIVRNEGMQPALCKVCDDYIISILFSSEPRKHESIFYALDHY